MLNSFSLLGTLVNHIQPFSSIRPPGILSLYFRRVWQPLIISLPLFLPEDVRLKLPSVGDGADGVNDEEECILLQNFGLSSWLLNPSIRVGGEILVFIVEAVGLILDVYWDCSC